MKCPNCNMEMTKHTTSSSVSSWDTEGHEFELGRLSIEVCPECYYYDEQTLTMMD